MRDQDITEGILSDFSMASRGLRLCPVPPGLSSPEAHQLFCEGSSSGLEGAPQDPLLGSGYPDSAACRLGLGSLCASFPQHLGSVLSSETCG